MYRFISVFVFLAALAMTTACNENYPQLKPNISGKAGEVGIIVDKGNWEGELGISIRSILAAEYPFLPQAEPLFTLFSVSQNAFTSIFQSHRNLVLINISPELSEAKMVIQQDVWAAPQIVITFSGPNYTSVIACVESNKEKLLSALEQAERNRVIINSKRYEEKSLRMLVNESFGGSPYFPSGYAMLRQSKDFIWIAYLTTYTNQAILIYSYPYVDTSSFSKAEVIRQRNEVLKREVPGPLENTYMITGTYIEPDLRWVHYNHKDFAELRGLWDVQNDFMGGPFTCHLFLDKTKTRVIVLDAFVYAPRYEKRNYMRQAESIIYSFDWVEDQPKEN